jgi:hypothetical protein
MYREERRKKKRRKKRMLAIGAGWSDGYQWGFAAPVGLRI